MTPTPLLCLLDSGATGCWICQKRLPPSIHGKTVPKVTNQTLAGTFTSTQETSLQQVILLEFYCTRRLDNLSAKLFFSACRYDMILGRDFLNSLGLILAFKNKDMTWDKSTIAMHKFLANTSSTELATTFLLDAVEDLDLNDGPSVPESEPSASAAEIQYQEKDAGPDGYKSKWIRSSLYEKSGLTEILEKCTYVSTTQKQYLFKLLSQFPKLLFDGKLKTFKGPPFHLELIDNPVPVRRRPVRFPRSSREE